MEAGLIEVIDKQRCSSDESHKKITIRGCTIEVVQSGFQYASMQGASM